VKDKVRKYFVATSQGLSRLFFCKDFFEEYGCDPSQQAYTYNLVIKNNKDC
jgi:hypothetical protein